MNFHVKVMASLRNKQSVESARLADLLESGKLHPIADEPASTTASEALRLWRTRLRNTRITQKKISGLSEVVIALEKITPQKKIDQFGFNDENTAVTLFFEKTSGAFLGSITVAK